MSGFRWKINFLNRNTNSDPIHLSGPPASCVSLNRQKTNLRSCLIVYSPAVNLTWSMWSMILMPRDVFEHLNLNTWKQDDERAPHKPLLVLWAIGRCLRGDARLVEYRVVHDELGSLLQRFGHPRRKPNPHYPFWRLQRDKIWEIPGADRLTENGKGDVSPKELRELNVRGGLTKDLFERFRRDKSATLEICLQMVETHFTPTLLIPVP